MVVSLSSSAEACCWIRDLTIVGTPGQDQVLYIDIDETAELGNHLALPVEYFPFLRTATGTIHLPPWQCEGSGITSAITWPGLGERRTVNQLHALHFEHQMLTMFAR